MPKRKKSSREKALGDVRKTLNAIDKRVKSGHLPSFKEARDAAKAQRRLDALPKRSVAKRKTKDR